MIRADECDRAWGHSFITPRHICIVSKSDAVREGYGDSGGPLQCKLSGRYTLAGPGCFGTRRRGATYPGGYARITQALSWIEQVMANKTRHF